MDTIQNRSERRQYWSEEPNTATEEVVIAEEKSTEDVNREATDPSEESQEESRNFKYPLTLSKSFPATIKFTAVKTEGVDIAEKIGKLIGETKDALVDAVQSVGETSYRYATGISEGGRTGLAAEAPATKARVETEKGEAQQASYFQTYENKGGGERVGSVTLPLQRDLRYSDLAQYETANLGLAGGAL